MPDLLLRDILINARQEAARMHHHFIGVEHLVVGALMLSGGIIASLVERYGYKPDYVIDAMRRHSGKGSRQRLWSGLPNTPRADVVLGVANDLALEDGRTEINERDLLRAVIEESDSIPTRIFQRLGIDLPLLEQDIIAFSSTTAVPLPYVKVEFAPAYDAPAALDEQHLFILRRMFYGYARVRVERQLTGGFSRALLLAVTPVQQDGSEDAMVVVKIDEAHIILDEARRFEQHVRATLPPLTARLEDRPTAPETSDLAGLKYTFVAEMSSQPQDMREAVWKMGLAQLGAWLHHDLYPYFGRAWWDQRKPYRFPAWQEYDFVLPPLFILEALGAEDAIPQDAHLLRDPIRRDRILPIELGDIVVISGFVVDRVSSEDSSLQVTVGSGVEGRHRAHRIEIRGVDLHEAAHYRGEVIDQLAGRVFSTRSELLFASARALTPDFDVYANTVPMLPPLNSLPNPLLHYDQMLDTHVTGSVSRIHGDLHLGNILLGPNNSGFLIDFAQARSGHTLFDWATLEISLLNDLVMRLVGESWADARRVLFRVAALDGTVENLPDPLLDDALTPLEALREIVSQTLARSGEWSEYWVALGLCALRAVRWETMSIGGSRLMFLVAAYCCAMRFKEDGQGSDSSLTAGGELDLSDATLSQRSSPPNFGG